MIEESKVSLMAKAAIYEKNEAQGSIAISKYYKNDYVRFNVLKTWVAVTVAFWTIVGSYVYMSFDKLLEQIDEVDYFDIMYKMLGRYVLVCFVYFVIAMLLYSHRYEKARPGLVEYNSNLRDLIELQGGPAHHKKPLKRVKSTAKNNAARRLEDAITEAEIKNDPFAQIAPTSRPNTRINKVELLRMREQEAQRVREQQILENVKKRNERIAAQNAERLRREKKYEEDRRAIQEKRKQLELQQMQRLKTESMNRVNRQNHKYNSDSEEG